MNSKLIVGSTFLSFLLILFVSCNSNKQTSDVEELFTADRTFSDMSLNEGMVAAFIHYCHDEGILLRPNSMPIVGKDSVVARIHATNDSLFTLTWEPLDGDISKSGDLGFTYGIYTMNNKVSKSLSYGTYVSIWKKNKDGEWRYMMDTGQEGIKPQP
ncbi:YybH family protein [Bacteroidota bacterium]